MAPSWIPHTRTCMQRTSLHSSVPICLPTASSISKWPPKAFAKLQGHLWVSCFPHFSDTFLKTKQTNNNNNKKKHAHFFIECHSGRKTGLEYLDFNFQKTWSLVFFFFLIKPPHNLKFLHALIIQFQHTKLLLHRVPMERPPQQENHRFCHESAARCPPPFSAWAATGFLNPCTLLSF